jgi:hypothetical protein
MDRGGGEGFFDVGMWKKEQMKSEIQQRYSERQSLDFGEVGYTIGFYLLQWLYRPDTKFL